MAVSIGKIIVGILKNFQQRARFSHFKPTRAKALGDWGERKAAHFLKKRGMKILVRNFKFDGDEIDIVCRDGNSLVFVEVKTRTVGGLVGGYYAAVQTGKRAAVRRCAKAYSEMLNARPASVRFDVVEIEVPVDFRIPCTGFSSLLCMFLRKGVKNFSIAHFPNAG